MVTMTKPDNMSNTSRSGRQISPLNDGSRALTNATEQWAATAAECHREMIGFVAMRLEKDSETSRKIMACRNFADMTAIQSQWLEETLRDYSSEMARLMTIYTKLAKDGVKIGK